jgi:cell division protein FtsA
MNHNRIVTAIDVGTTKVATIIAECDEETKAVRVIGVGIAPSYGMHKGLVVDINDAKESIRESVRRAEQACSMKITSAYVGVTGRHVVSNNSHGVVAITNGDKVVKPNDLRRVMSTTGVSNLSSDRKLLHVIPRNYSVDGQAGVKDPVGMHGERLDVETHIITAASNSINNLAQCVHGIGLNIDDMVLEPLASSEAVLTEEERQAGVAIADIGGGTTDVCIFRDGSIFHTAVLPVAGYQMTRDIAIGLGLGQEVAEEMKKRYGSVVPIEDENAIDQIAKMSEDSQGVAYQTLCEILRDRVEELIRMIILELPSSNYKAIIPSGLVLTGGSSNIAGIEQLSSSILKLPVRIGYPLHVTGITDVLRDPAHATGVGLLLWGSKNYGKKSNWNKRSFGERLRGLASKFASLFG